MRRDSLFNAVVNWINQQQDSTWAIKQLISEVSKRHEQRTAWKNWNNNPFYRTRQYIGYLKRAGLIQSPKWGHYQRCTPIPDLLTITDLECHLGYTNARVNDKGEWTIKPKKQHPLTLNPQP